MNGRSKRGEEKIFCVGKKKQKKRKKTCRVRKREAERVQTAWWCDE